MGAFIRARQPIITRLFPHQANKDYMVGSRPPGVADQSYTGVAPHTTFDIVYGSRIKFASGIAGWVFTGSVTGALALLTGVLDADGLTVHYTTTVGAIATETVTAVYTAAAGNYEPVIAGPALPDQTVDFGVAP